MTERAHLDEWQLFTNRYGVRSPDNTTWPDKLPWAARHNMPDADGGPHRCVCPGVSLGTSGCVLRATQEDFLCDECRLWCVAVDAEGKYHQLSAVNR